MHSDVLYKLQVLGFLQPRVFFSVSRDLFLQDTVADISYAVHSQQNIVHSKQVGCWFMNVHRDIWLVHCNFKQKVMVLQQELSTSDFQCPILQCIRESTLSIIMCSSVAQTPLVVQLGAACHFCQLSLPVKGWLCDVCVSPD